MIHKKQEENTQQKSGSGGRNARLPMGSDMSIAGISSDQTEAATMTPEANPSKSFCARG